MPKKKESIYLETSVISAYFDFWGKNPQQKRETQEFWREILPKYEPIISRITLTELEEAKENWKQRYLKLVNGIKITESCEKAEKLAISYIKNGIIPKSKADDAAHLAISVINKIDFFLTWNMQHFLRPHKLKQIADFNKSNNLHLPILTKPIDFL